MNLRLTLLSSLIVISLYACNEADSVPEKVEQTITNSSGTNIQAGHDAHVTINYQKSEDYQYLINKRTKLKEKIKKHPDDADYYQELTEVESEIKAFERDVLQLAATINSIPRDSERLRKATEYFEAGEFDKARVVLDIGEITQDQETLLKQKDAVQTQLAANANELILLAQATAVDYKLGEERIAKTRGYFEQALKSDRSAKNVFSYAYFLDENNQFKLANDYYVEALTLRRQLAKVNPDIYLPNVANTLNNLAILVSQDTQRRNEAETLHNEALSLRRQLAKQNPNVYLPDVAGTLNNLAILVRKDTKRRNEAESLFNEALTLYRQLAKDNPNVYLPDVATTLNNLANLVSKDTQRRKEAETLYNEALSLRRQLAKDDPNVYLPNLVNTLGGYGLAHLQWNNKEKAFPLLKEAAEILSPLAQQYPTIYGDKQAFNLYLAAQASGNDDYACQTMQEAAQVVQTREDIKQIAEKAIALCKKAGILK